MKKFLAVGLAMLFMAAAGMAWADGTACAGKKCKGHHWHKKGSKTLKAGTLDGNTVPSK